MESLTEFVRRTKSALSDADTGPLVIARDVMRVANQWDSYRDQAGGLDCTSFLRKTFGRGRGLDWFMRRDEAVTILGESVRRSLHHTVAIYVASNVPNQFHAPIVETLTREKKRNGGNVLSLNASKPLIEAIVGKKLKLIRSCLNCAELRGELEALRRSIGSAAE